MNRWSIPVESSQAASSSWRSRLSCFVSHQSATVAFTCAQRNWAKGETSPCFRTSPVHQVWKQPSSLTSAAYDVENPYAVVDEAISEDSLFGHEWLESWCLTYSQALFFISLIKRSLATSTVILNRGRISTLNHPTAKKKNPPFSLIPRARKNVNVRKIFPLNISSVHWIFPWPLPPMTHCDFLYR